MTCVQAGGSKTSLLVQCSTLTLLMRVKMFTSAQQFENEPPLETNQTTDDDSENEIAEYDRLVSIFPLAQSCDNALHTLCEALPTSPYHDLNTVAAEEAARFKIWASNIGSMQERRYSSSLDSRLINSGRMRSSVASGLRRLIGAATKCRATQNPHLSGSIEC